ncbi:5-(carboxyamino)imidazole ribonucleotide synthase [Amorphus orientalis]|uniref:N5-carboxyaminoimidazole ribonucleotide synthase n=1 Tax=Amorphus orientalis TaxID=649198 RepID=A0AAE3VLI8_9HYPH|nr:5-(carboxyamino)imidazole ribonucleotide synthase [Amorphus orientalis]MDQ0314240.1 5-(carboxyamino)imidazole ribonucleotide synthase [Amorphus orientalis]
MSDLSPAALSPGGTIGILGGGQLGRMIALAAGPLGLDCHVFCPDPDSPAFRVAARHTVAEYTDTEALKAFAESVDVVTYEFENVPAETLELIAPHAPIRPGAKSLAVSQDRLSERRFLAEIGVPTAAHARVDGEDDIVAGLETTGAPAILKTRRFGYDGKGQTTVRDASDAERAFAAIGGQPAILEERIDFRIECSVVVARSEDGQAVVYDIAENRHENHILKISRVPADIEPRTAQEAAEIGIKTADALGHVGVVAVELFVVGSGDDERLIANEIAPRVHNSGHWTQDGTAASQFENHVRAVAGWPLVAPHRHFDVEMENLIGHDVDRWPDLVAEAGAHLHLYGKRDVRPGRKMGHVNRVRPRER